MNVEWDGSGGKPQDIRKEKNRTNSPMHSPARCVCGGKARLNWNRMSRKSSNPCLQVSPDVPEEGPNSPARQRQIYCRVLHGSG